MTQQDTILVLVAVPHTCWKHLQLKVNILRSNIKGFFETLNLFEELRRSKKVEKHRAI